MGLFKKKTSEAAAEGKEFEETLVAEEPTAEPAEGAVLAEEPVPETPTASWAPDVTEMEFPEELEEHLRRDNSEVVLLEKYLNRPTKTSFEAKATPSPRSALKEKTWHPKHRASLHEIRRGIDHLQVKPVKSAGWLRAKFKPFADAGLERIPANIIGKRIVYETEGGFVVEVTYRDGPETRKKFFTVDVGGDRTRALEEIQTGRYAKTHMMGTDAVANLSTPKRPASLPTPPGKVQTWPISNKIDVTVVEGIGDKYARRLHELGIHTTDQLRLMNATVIANNLNAVPTQVEKWQHMCELMTINGVGKQIAESLAMSGITSVDQLRKMTPKKVATQVKAWMKQTGRTKGSIRPLRARAIIVEARKMRKATQPFPVVEA